LSEAFINARKRYTSIVGDAVSFGFLKDRSELESLFRQFGPGVTGEADFNFRRTRQQKE
jgi:hypothetical protein